MTQTATVQSRIAGLADGPQQVISGVAVGSGDVTRGLSGDRKVWTEDELKEAAETLEGGDLKALHSETPVGEVTDAGFVEGEGVVYEAEVNDAELAEAIANGRLTVSVEARHADGGTVDTDRGEAMRAADIEFSDLAIVQRGAAPSASAEPGEAAALEAALAPAAIHAALEDEDPASTEGDASDIDISDQTETALENKVEEHNEEVGEGKQVTLAQLKKVYRRGAGAWFSSNKGATQNQWALARVNEALSDIKSEKAINHGNDNDIFEDSLDYSPPEEEQSAALVDVNGTEVDLEAPARVKNAIEAAMDAKAEYADEIGDCGTGVGEEMGQTILDDGLTPEIITSGGGIAQYGPSTYLDGHGDEGPATDDPPTDWGREEWLGIVDGGSPRCGPVQLGLWGYYLGWFESAKQEVEAAMEDSEMMDDMTVPEEYRFGNPGEAVEQAKYLGVGEDRDLAGDEMIHTREMDGETMFFPAPTREELLDRLRAEDELADPLVDRPTGGDTRAVVHTPTEESPDEATLDAIRESVADRTGVDLSMTATEAGVLTEATPDVGIGVREFVHEHLDIVESVVQNALGKPQKSSLHVAGDADGLSLHPCFEVDGDLSDATLSRMAETFALVANHRVAVGMMDGMVAFDPRDPVLSHAALDVAEIIARRAADEAGVTVTSNTFRAAEMLDDGVVEPPSLPAEAGHHDMEDNGEESEMAVDVALPMPSESVQLLYPERSVAADAARAMGLGSEDDADGDITHPHDFEGETWYMPGETHGAFVDAVSGMDAGMAGTAPVARLNEYKAVGPIEFRGTREGDLDESAIPTGEYESHYFNAGDTKSDSSFPLVDSEGYLRRGNLDAAWGLRGQGDLGMPRDSAERLMLNLGLVFGPPDSEANPLPEEPYQERDDVGTPYAEEAAALAAVVDAVAGPRQPDRPDDPGTGEVPAAAAATAALSEHMDDEKHDAALGSYLANAMRGKMEEMAYNSEMGHAEMMREMASHCGMSESHMRSIRRGDTGCPSLDAIEAMSEVLDADMGMLMAAAERDGCEYSNASYHDSEDSADNEERMADSTTKELKATLADKTERIEELENEVETLRAERDAVASEYAEALAGEETVLDAETLATKFDVAELAEMYEESEAALAPEDVEPAVRSGSDGSTPESEALTSDDRERVAELEDELSQWEQRDSRLAAVRVEEIEDELADLRGDN